MNYKIALDGPSGTGKSTTAKLLAKKLNYIYIDTGAMYRAVGLFCDKNKIDVNNEEKVKENLDKININLFYKDGVQEILLNDEIVSKEIRQNHISSYASIVSQYKDVREKLVSMQQKLAKENSVIMDGRDIGTIVLPDADLKIYLVASNEVRAERRFKELIEKGEKVTKKDILKELEERDYRDTHRKNSPLRKAINAIEVDNSNLTIEETVDKIYELFKEKVGI